jgi:hypothetical protein
MHIQDYLQLVYNSEKQLAEAFTKVAEHHKTEPDIYYTCLQLASWSKEHLEKVETQLEKYSESALKSQEPELLSQMLLKEPREGSLSLLKDLQDLWLLTKGIEICWSILLQAAAALRDMELESMCDHLNEETIRQSEWLQTRIKQAAPELLVVAE